MVPELAASIIYTDTTQANWKDLQEQFSQPNTTKICEVKKAKSNCLQIRRGRATTLCSFSAAARPRTPGLFPICPEKLSDGMKPKDLDMTETLGTTIWRKTKFSLVPTPHTLLG
ncbi:hypothetical protein Fot_39375 [Forsythia ovata]|uniref:Uncharacterized protein n=1 Tax=Forsythia ovata TaxID=205694 RepID=A0ABD1S4E9_9LAMI